MQFHSYTSKIDRFAKIVDVFQPKIIFEKHSILNVWHGSEHACLADVYSSLREETMQLQELPRLLQGRNIKFSSYCFRKECQRAQLNVSPSYALLSNFEFIQACLDILALLSIFRVFQAFFKLVKILLFRHSLYKYQIRLYKLNLMCDKFFYQIINFQLSIKQSFVIYDVPFVAIYFFGDLRDSLEERLIFGILKCSDFGR